MLGGWESICFLLLCGRPLGTFDPPPEVLDEFLNRMYKLKDVLIFGGNGNVLHAVIELNFAVDLSHDYLECSTCKERGCSNMSEYSQSE